MTMFTRTDKGPETAPGVGTPRERPETPVATAAELKPASPSPSLKPVVSVAPASQPSGPSVSVISKALKITGQLESTEDIQIEGEIDGDVRGVNVKVGSNAKVKGTVYGEEVELSGTVDGKIEARKVSLTRTAHMSGDVVHQEIVIQAGAFIDGHCRPEFGKTEIKRVIPAHTVIKGTAE
jgi:cytoskeletal protein CcmA (bactofilin family)